jgi:hypothetical protein
MSYYLHGGVTQAFLGFLVSFRLEIFLIYDFTELTYVNMF